MGVAIEHHDILHLDAFSWNKKREKQTPLLSRLAEDLISNGFKDVGPQTVKVTVTDQQLTRYIDSFIVYYYDSSTNQASQGAFGIRDWTSTTPISFVSDYFYDGNSLKPKRIEDNTYKPTTPTDWNNFIAEGLPGTLSSAGGQTYVGNIQRTKFLGPNAELFSYLNPHPVNRDTEGNWLKNTPNTVPIEGLTSEQDGYVGLPRMAEEVYKNEFNKIKTLMTTNARGVVAYPDSASGVDSVGNLRHYKEEKFPDGSIEHNFWITTYTDEEFFPADVTTNEAYEGRWGFQFATGYDKVQPDDVYDITLTGTKMNDNSTISETAQVIAPNRDLGDFTSAINEAFKNSNIGSTTSGVLEINNETGEPEGTTIPVKSITKSINWVSSYVRTARTLLSGLTYNYAQVVTNTGLGSSNLNGKQYKFNSDPTAQKYHANTYDADTFSAMRSSDTVLSRLGSGKLTHFVQAARNTTWYTYAAGSNYALAAGFAGTYTDGTSFSLPSPSPSGGGTPFEYSQIKTAYPNYHTTVALDNSNGYLADSHYLNRNFSIWNTSNQKVHAEETTVTYDVVRTTKSNGSTNTTSGLIGNASIEGRNFHLSHVVNGYVHEITIDGITGANKGDLITINLTGVVDESNNTAWVDETIDISYTMEVKKQYPADGGTSVLLLADIIQFLNSDEAPYTRDYMEAEIDNTFIRLRYNPKSSAYMNRLAKKEMVDNNSGDTNYWGLFNSKSDITNRTSSTYGTASADYWIYGSGTIFGNTLAEYANGNWSYANTGFDVLPADAPAGHTNGTFLDSNGQLAPEFIAAADGYESDEDSATPRRYSHFHLTDSSATKALAQLNTMRLAIDSNYAYPTDGTDIPIKFINPHTNINENNLSLNKNFLGMYSWDIPTKAKFEATFSVVQETQAAADPLEISLSQEVPAALSNVNRIRLSFPFSRDLGTYASPVRKTSFGVFVASESDKASNYAQSYYQNVLQAAEGGEPHASTRLSRPVGPEVSFDFQQKLLHPNQTHSGTQNGLTNWSSFEYHVSNLEILDFEYVLDRSMGPLVFETSGSLGGKNPTNNELNEQPWRIRFDVSRGTEMVETSPYINDKYLQKVESSTDSSITGNSFEYLTVHIATPYQLLSNGDVTDTSLSNDIMQKAITREPGFLGGLRRQYQGYLGTTIHKNNPYTQRNELKSVIANKLNRNAGRVGLYHSVVDGFPTTLGGVWDNSSSVTDVVYLDASGTVENGLLENGEYRYEEDFLIGTSSELLHDTPFNTGTARVQKGFYRRTGRSGALSSSYPMTYTLSIASHGMAFHIKDHASHTEEGRNAFFVVQRHVDSTTGEPDFSSASQPVHCVYASSESPTLYSDLTPYFKTEETSRYTALGQSGIYDVDGNFVTDFTVDEVVEADLKAFDLNEQGRFRRFIVRERDVLKPWDRHVFAGLNERDSHAVLNPLEQLSLNDDGQLVIQFPTRIGSQRYIFTGQEIDMIGFVDAGSVGEDTVISSDRFTVANGVSKRRLYRGLGSTDAFGNGMRILFLQGGFSMQTTFIDTSLL